MHAALLQLNCSDDPAVNLPLTLGMVDEAAGVGAQFIATPEVTNIVSRSRPHQRAVLQEQSVEPTLAALREKAAEHGVWVLIGSLALREGEHFVNRSFLIGPGGEIAAHYDKVHMFDVAISAQEEYHESAYFRPGTQAVLADTPFGKLGMAICYDMRFPALSSALAQAGAQIIAYPSAFSVVTGAAHWESLLRARAIENGAWVIAPAQTGTHTAADGNARKTYGHSLVVSPWGDIVLDAGTLPGVHSFELDMAQVSEARKRIPSLAHRREFQGP